MNTFRAGAVAVAFSLVLMAGPACSSGEGGRAASPARPASSAPAAPAPTLSESETAEGSVSEEASARVVDTDFRPGKLSVSAGTTVTWEQVGDQPHSVSSSDELFESSPKCSPTASDMCLGEGDAFTFTFEEPGTFEYYCRVHGLPDGTGMAGIVVVR